MMTLMQLIKLVLDDAYKAIHVTGEAEKDSLINAELKRAPADRDWHRVLGALEAMTARAESIGCEELWASAIRSRILVYAAQLSDVGAASGPLFVTLAVMTVSCLLNERSRARYAAGERVVVMAIVWLSGAKAAAYQRPAPWEIVR